MITFIGFLVLVAGVAAIIISKMPKTEKLPVRLMSE